ncbi:MAG: redox-regulated ATPase YchF [Candidatus Aenigmatarchaeota archaeon]
MIQIGVVGKSNTGKSTFFKAATLIDIEISNRIFTTIKPNQGVAYVTAECPCKTQGVTCKPKNSKCIDGIRYIPVRLIDIAGLVPDAHKGKGLGNQFLTDIMTASGLIHVVDLSGGTDGEGNPVKAGSHDPEEDIHFLPREIDYWMFQILKNNWKQLSKKAETTDAKLEDLIYEQLSGLQLDYETVRDEVKKLDIEVHTKEDHLIHLVSELRKRNKPIVIAGNKIDTEDGQKNFKLLHDKHKHIIPCTAECELALREANEHGFIKYNPGDKDFEIVVAHRLTPKQISALEFIKEKILVKYESTGIQNILNHTVFETLDMIAVYPVTNIGKMTDKDGNVLPDVHLVPRGTHLKQFAGKIHTDLADKFIGGMKTDRKKVGAEYELKDGDIVEILTKK